MFQHWPAAHNIFSSVWQEIILLTWYKKIIKWISRPLCKAFIVPSCTSCRKEDKLSVPAILIGTNGLLDWTRLKLGVRLSPVASKILRRHHWKQLAREDRYRLQERDRHLVRSDQRTSGNSFIGFNQWNFDQVLKNLQGDIQRTLCSSAPDLAEISGLLVINTYKNPILWSFAFTFCLPALKCVHSTSILSKAFETHKIELFLIISIHVLVPLYYSKYMDLIMRFNLKQTNILWF